MESFGDLVGCSRVTIAKICRNVPVCSQIAQKVNVLTSGIISPVVMDRGAKKGSKHCHGEFKHGMSREKEHAAWRRMRNRCINQNDRSFRKYGGNGITICPRWEEFTNFYKDMKKQPKTRPSLFLLPGCKEFNKDNCK